MLVAVGIGICVLLAYSNGANDNFKGVATLYGSGTTTYRRALGWATVSTLAGSLGALILSQGLIAKFSGRGLVTDAVAAMPGFSLSVGLAAGLTVFLATRFGLPISTTHALIGALAGAGWIASGSVNLKQLGNTFFLPLLFTPILAMMAAAFLYPLLKICAKALGLTGGHEVCICVQAASASSVLLSGAYEGGGADLSLQRPSPTISAGRIESCQVHGAKSVVRMRLGQAQDALHFLSAGVVGFARGLNDTPKIAALFLTGSVVSVQFAIVATAVFMMLGGLLHAKKIAETMSHRVTKMDPDHGFVGNLVTGFIVISASKLALPVSTTHVSCGALFGIGAATGMGFWKTIGTIVLAWITTLPIAAASGAILFPLVKLL